MELPLVHLVRQPARSVSGRPPLLLLSHGLGSNEADLFGLAPYLDPRFLIISVRAPISYGSGYAWFDLQILPDRYVANQHQAAESAVTLKTFLEQAISYYKIDPQRVYLVGFSQGAIMGLTLALTQPELVTGLVAMSGRFPDEIESQMAEDDALNSKPVLVVHGLYDPVLPIQSGRHIRDRLQRLPVDLTYREYPMAHQVSEESLRDITQWLTHQLDAGT